MKLKHYFVLLALGILVLAGIALFATFSFGSETIYSPPSQGGGGGGSAGGGPAGGGSVGSGALFYVTEVFVVLLLFYLWYFYRKTIRPYDTLIGGIELVRDLDLTTRLAPSGQHETDIIVRTFNNLLNRLRSEHLKLEEQYTFLNLLIEASPMGVIQCDLDGNITSMNSAAREMLSPSIEEAIHALPLGETTTVRIPGEPQLFRISHQSFPDRGFQHPFFLIESLTSEVRLAEKAAYERVIRMIAHEVNNSVAGIISGLSASCSSIKNAKVIAFQTPQIPGYGTSNGVSLKVEDPLDGDMTEFSEKTDAFLAKLQQRPEIGVAMSTYSERFPQYEVIVDAAQCGRSGVSVKTVVNTLGNYCSGSYIGNYNKFGKVYKIMVAAAPEYRLDESSLQNIFVKVKGGRMAPLTEFVSLKEVVGPSLLEHFNCYQAISCNVTIAPGYSEGEAQNAIAEVFKEEMPSSYTYEYSDMSREVEETANSNTTTIIYCICVILIYLILVSLYESWFVPWAVLLSVPFGLMGAFCFVYVCSLFGMSGMDNNVYLQTGVIMLIGLLSKTAILITEVASEHRKQGLDIAEAAFRACQERLRPILMTVACMIIGMLPLVIEGGAGANGNRALALGVAGGMSIGTIALIFVVPAFFIVMQKLHEKFQSTPKVVEVKEV